MHPAAIQSRRTGVLRRAALMEPCSPSLSALARWQAYEAVGTPPTTRHHARSVARACPAPRYSRARRLRSRGGPAAPRRAYGADAGQEEAGGLMLSTDITDTPAYSGKPVVTLIGMDRDGNFAGMKMLKHSEPILLLGIPESALVKFNQQYLGKFDHRHIEVGPRGPRTSSASTPSPAPPSRWWRRTRCDDDLRLQSGARSASESTVRPRRQVRRQRPRRARPNWSRKAWCNA